MFCVHYKRGTNALFYRCRCVHCLGSWLAQQFTALFGCFADKSLRPTHFAAERPAPHKQFSVPTQLVEHLIFVHRLSQC